MPMGQMRKTIKLNVRMPTKLWPYQVVDEIQKVMEEGMKKYPNGEGWNETAQFHIERAIIHLTQVDRLTLLPEDRGDSDLAHAFTRLMMAMAIERGYTKEDVDA